MSVNKIILIGNVGADPVTKQIDSENLLATFSLATTENFKDHNGNKVSQTTWHNIVCWRSIAIVAKNFIKKGSQIYIEGKVSNRSYEDASGNAKYISEVNVTNLQLLGRKPEPARLEPISDFQKEPADISTDPSDDLPH